MFLQGLHKKNTLITMILKCSKFAEINTSKLTNGGFEQGFHRTRNNLEGFLKFSFTFNFFQKFIYRTKTSNFEPRKNFYFPIFREFGKKFLEIKKKNF